MDVNKIIGIIDNHDGDAVELAKSLGGALEKRRAKTAKKRAGGQELPPSKYMPEVPRAVHADGGFALPEVRPSTDDPHEVGQASFDHYDVLHDSLEPIENLSGGVNLTHPNQRKRVDALKAKISHPEEGYISRVIVDDDGNVIEGQHRLEALRELGATHVPVTVLRNKAKDIDLGALHNAIKGKGGIMSDHVKQIAEMAIDSVMESGHPAKAREDWEAPQGFEDRWNAALNEIERQYNNKKTIAKKAEGGEIAAPPAAEHEHMHPALMIPGVHIRGHEPIFSGGK